jgi:hypothetical protein
LEEEAAARIKAQQKSLEVKAAADKVLSDYQRLKAELTTARGREKVRESLIRISSSYNRGGLKRCEGGKR